MSLSEIIGRRYGQPRRRSNEKSIYCQFAYAIGPCRKAWNRSIKLTQGTKDGGVDVHAEKNLGSHGYFKAVWQARKKSLPRKVGLSVVRELAGFRTSVQPAVSAGVPGAIFAQP
jgi:hypothetical protein